MKRVKVMLLAIAVIAIAAGTLAFKARYSIHYCTVAANETAFGQYTCTTTNPLGGNRPLTCNHIALDRKVTTSFVVPVCTTLFTVTQPMGDPTCVNTLNCGLTKIDIE